MSWVVKEQLLKEQLRKKFLNIRKNIVLCDAEVLSFRSNLVKALSDLDFDYKSVGLYKPIGSEIDIKSLTDDLAIFVDKTILFPKVIDKKSGQMIFCENDHSIAQRESSLIPDIVIIPMLAFGKDLYRLGYGGGYYDRFLAENKRHIKLKIGIAYDEQFCEEDFVDKHDIAMDIIVTPTKIIYG